MNLIYQAVYSKDSNMLKISPPPNISRSVRHCFESLNSYFESLNSYFQSLNSYFQSLNSYFERAGGGGGVQISVRNTKVYKIREICRAISSAFYNISRPNFAILLILKCSF